MAANKCCAASSSLMSGPAGRDQANGHVSLANAIAHLNTVSAGVSVEPADYNWGTPSVLQQQALYAQFFQLAFMCSLPQMQYAHFSSLQAARPPMFPAFLPPFPGFMPPVATPSPTPSPPPAPCSPAVPEATGLQQFKSGSGRQEGATVRVGKNLASSKKSGAAAKAKSQKHAATVNKLAPASPAGAALKVEPDMELEDICRLLGDDDFLGHLQDDVLSEGSNGSSSTSNGRMLSKNNSNGCLSGSVNNNDGAFFAPNSFASTFDLDIDPELTVTAAASECKPQAPVQSPPCKATSGDLNNLVAASAPARSARSTRSAAREAAAAAAAIKDVAASPTKISLKVAKGGVQKVASSKPSKSQTAAAAAAVAAAAASTADVQTQPAEECQLTAADLSRLLGEDDNRIPDGWELDLDFENPFSCEISAF